MNPYSSNFEAGSTYNSYEATSGQGQLTLVESNKQDDPKTTAFPVVQPVGLPLAGAVIVAASLSLLPALM